MKKYLQYDAIKYSSPHSDVGIRTPRGSTPVSPGSGSQDVLDLSAKADANAVAMVTGQKWNAEQDAAPLDLSGYSRQQDEALDLTKPASQPRNNGFNQPRPLSHPSHQSNRPLYTPPSSRHSRSPASQSYSLLQAALNSNQPDAGLVEILQTGGLLDSRSLLYSGNLPGDGSRGIKPFTTAKPLGISVPHMGHHSGAIIQGTKPIAITTPQPHNPPVNTKSQSVSDTTVSVTDANQSISSTCNQGYFVSQSNYTNSYGGRITDKKFGVAKAISQLTDSSKINNPNAMIERYMLQNPDHFPGHLLPGPNMIQSDLLNGFSCTQCSKVFKTKATMKLHMTVHKTTEERQYGCQVCGRRFLHRHHLVVHQRKHSGEKPFKCNACSKTFMAIFLLHKHLRKHARETGSVSEVSIEQLKQLQEQKLITAGPQPLTYNNVPPGQEPVIVLDDETNCSNDKTLSKKPVKEEIERKVGEVIGEINRDPNHASVVLPVLKNRSSSRDVNKTIPSLPVIKIPKSEVVNDNSIDMNPELAHHGHSVSSDSKVHFIQESETLVDKDDKTTIPIVGSIVAVQENSLTKEGLKEPKVEESANPFPEYTSDDEVELDFNTGELIVKKNKKVDDRSIGSPDTETADEETDIRDDIEFELGNNAVSCELKDHVKEENVKEETVESMAIEVNKAENIGKIPELTKDDPDTNLETNGTKELHADKEVLQTIEISVKQEITEMQVKHESSNNESETIKSDVHETMSEMKDHVCALEESAKEESTQEATDETCQRPSETQMLQPIESQTNIFDKMYESVNDVRLRETHAATARGKRGKKKGRKVKCEICSRTFHSSHYLLLHMAVHKRNPMLQSLKKAKANQIKVLGYVNKTNVACEVCKKVFKFQKSLNSHMRVHSEKLIEQKLYRKAFRDFVSGTTPQSVCKAEKKSRISEGSESQEKIPEVKGRLSLESSTSECSIKSDRPTSDTGDDEPPIKVVLGADNVKRYLCHACDNSYTTKQKLRLHALIHKDNCFLCDICGKSFFRQLTLEKHISTHKLPRPHICEICKKSFIHRSSLMRHKTAHQKPVIPNPKQQLADINFEMKMRDTYTLLQEERLHQIKKHLPKTDQVTGLPKYDPLDLTVRIKSEEQLVPPVLSPANTSSMSQSTSWNLSPPLITEDSLTALHAEKYEDTNTDINQRVEMIQSAKLSVKRKSRTESGCSESDVLSSDGNSTMSKKARKTRVYQTSCRVCKEAFPNVMMLKSHMAVHNTVETHLYECHICRHRFTQSCSLLRHLKTSCQENRMKCVPCNKTFHRRNTFEQHMKLHEGGPSNLDGSFYDKRKDEAEVREERESDIENNNSAKPAEVVVTPLTIENVTLFDKVNNQEIKQEEDGNDSESDAQTYLYSEGEVHSRPSDLSDGEEASSKGPKHYNVPQDLTKNNMTLNLLSAVCSELRNAEKEEEEKRKEFEEKQKELETIEILANLKRGAMQKAVVEATTVTFTESKPTVVNMPVNMPVSTKAALEPTSPSKLQGPYPPLQRFPKVVKESTPVTHNQATTPQNSGIIRSPPPLQIGMKYPPSTEFNPYVRIPSVIDTNIAPSGPVKIPTVVQEASDRELSLRRNRTVGRNPTPPPLSPKMLPRDAAPLLQELQHLKAAAGQGISSIHERLSLLMKAQVTVPQSVSVPQAMMQALPSATLSRPTAATMMKLQVPVSTPAKLTIQSPKLELDAPEDLSVKKATVELAAPPTHHIPRSLPTMSRPQLHQRSPSIETKPDPDPQLPPEGLIIPRSEIDARFRAGTVPIPPPLVPVYQCDLCSKVVYNKIDLHLHRVEHAKVMGLEVLSGKKHVPKLSEPVPRPGAQAPLPEIPIDFTQTTVKTEPSTSKSSELSMSESLDLSVRKSANQPDVKPCTSSHPLKVPDLDPAGPQIHSAFTLKHLEKLSPVSGSDVSDSAPSPSAGANLDHQLRQELRDKIFSRRKSQGLDDLKVEFKQPEPSEMSEEERVKLLYRRECNRQAAQRSRMRKKDLVDNLLEELQTEEVIQSDLRRRLESLIAEKNMLLKVLQTHTCVKDKSQALISNELVQNNKTCEDADKDVLDETVNNSVIDDSDENDDDNVNVRLDIAKVKVRQKESGRTDDDTNLGKPVCSHNTCVDTKDEKIKDADVFMTNKISVNNSLYKCDNGSDLFSLKMNNNTFGADVSTEVTETLRALLSQVEHIVDKDKYSEQRC